MLFSGGFKMAHPVVRIVTNRLALRSSCVFHNRSKSVPLLSSCLFKSESSSSSSAPPKKILSLSMLLLQDGLDIQELPVIIRRTDKTMFPFSNHMYACEDVRPATAEDETFKYLLQQCSSASEVLKLLEVPGDKVTGYSASYALQRMCQLKEASDKWDDLDTFICTAVMNELYSTVRKEVATLSNDTLHSLVKCFLNSENFSEQCAESVQEEIEKRIGDSQFTVEDLCTLSHTLRNAPKYTELVNLIWIHIGSRYKDIDASNVARVSESLPHSHKYITRMIEKQASRFWWKLTGDDVVSVLNSFVRLNVFYGTALQNFGRWVSLNVHDVKDTDLMQIVTAYIHFNFSDSSLIRALERYIPAKGSKLDNNLLALVMEYCRGRRYLSPRILDAAAMHFCDKGDTYSPLQIFSVLRPFGQLNHLPPKTTAFLLKVENILSKEFSNFEAVHISELLCSFAYVKKVPVNFARKVLNPFFLGKLKALDEAQRAQAGLWLEMFQSAIMLETRGVGVPLIFKVDKNVHKWKDLSLKSQENRLFDVLEGMLGPQTVAKSTFSQKTVYVIDLEIHVKDRKAMHMCDSSRANSDVRLALLIQPHNHYCVNTRQLLGEYSMRNRHLTILKYTVVELPYTELARLTQPSQREKYLKNKLRPYIDCH